MILGLAFSAALLAQTTPAARAADKTTQGRHVDKHEQRKADAPDPDLIGFLGDYEDAADGLDPIGLSEQQAAEQQTDRVQAAAKKNKDGGGP